MITSPTRSGNDRLSALCKDRYILGGIFSSTTFCASGYLKLSFPVCHRHTVNPFEIASHSRSHENNHNHNLISGVVFSDDVIDRVDHTSVKMPGRTVHAAAAVVILAISVPILSFAAFTSAIALTLVGVRAAVLSIDFWSMVLLESWTRPAKSHRAVPKRPTLLTQHTVEFRPPMSRSRTNSFIDSQSLKRLSYRSDSQASLMNTPMNRDFEGIGGWRTSREDDDQSLWMNMKTRLDRGRSSSRVQKRAVTPGSLSASALNSPEAFPMPMRTPRPRPTTSGSASPQSYFSLQLPTSRSMVSLQNKRLSGLSFEKWDHGSQEGKSSLELDSQETEQIGLAI